MSVVAAGCHDASCAPPPFGTGGSRKGTAYHLSVTGRAPAGEEGGWTHAGDIPAGQDRLRQIQGIRQEHGEDIWNRFKQDKLGGQEPNPVTYTVDFEGPALNTPATKVPDELANLLTTPGVTVEQVREQLIRYRDWAMYDHWRRKLPDLIKVSEAVLRGERGLIYYENTGEHTIMPSVVIPNEHVKIRGTRKWHEPDESLSLLASGCQDASCAPPPVGAGGSHTSVVPKDPHKVVRRTTTPAPGSDNAEAVKASRGETGTEKERRIPHAGETVDVYRDLGRGREFKRGFPDKAAFSIRNAASVSGDSSALVKAAAVGIVLDRPRPAWANAAKAEAEATGKRGVHAFMRGEVSRYIAPAEAEKLVQGPGWEKVTYYPGTQDFFVPGTRQRVMGGEQAVGVNGGFYVKHPVLHHTTTPVSPIEERMRQAVAASGSVPDDLELWGHLLQDAEGAFPVGSARALLAAGVNYTEAGGVFVEPATEPAPEARSPIERAARLKAKVMLLEEFKFNPRQARDDHGRWTDGASVVAAHKTSKHMSEAEFRATAAAIDRALPAVPGHQPLTDAQYAAHEAKVAALTAGAMGGPLDTKVQHDHIDGKDGAYTPERTKVHDEIINSLVQDALARGVGFQSHAIVMGGLGGAGKSGTIRKFPEEVGIRTDERGAPASHLVVNPDDIKTALLERGLHPNLAGLSPAEHAAFLHEESSDIANRLLDIAQRHGMNVVLDGTLGSMNILRKIDALTDAQGPKYKVRGIFVDVPVEESVKSAIKRHRDGNDARRSGSGDRETRHGGRYVPPAVIRSSAPPEGSPYLSTNRGVFQALHEAGAFTAGSIVIDNTGISERKPLGKITARNGRAVTASAAPDPVQSALDALAAGQITEAELVDRLKGHRFAKPAPLPEDQAERWNAVEWADNAQPGTFGLVTRAYDRGLLSRDAYYAILSA